jgi:hypothetical protein
VCASINIEALVRNLVFSKKKRITMKLVKNIFSVVSTHARQNIAEGSVHIVKIGSRDQLTYLALG